MKRNQGVCYSLTLVVQWVDRGMPEFILMRGTYMFSLCVSEEDDTESNHNRENIVQPLQHPHCVIFAAATATTP